MQDKADGHDPQGLRQAAVLRAQTHQALVEANSDCLARAALDLIGLDSDPRSFEVWLETCKTGKSTAQ